MRRTAGAPLNLRRMCDFALDKRLQKASRSANFFVQPLYDVHPI